MRTLLLADDNVTVQRVVTLMFADEAFHVVTVSDGQAALDQIASQPPDIVLAGTGIRNVNGYEVARFVRSQPALHAVPVLLLTGAFEAVDSDRVAGSGAAGVIEKPLEPTIVISRVKELLGLSSQPQPTTTGRLITSADQTAPKPRPLRAVSKPAPQAERKRVAEPKAPAPSTWDELKEDSGLDPGASSVESAASPGRADYLDTLDSAFDSLDQHLAGGAQETAGRNPSPPLARDGGAVDPRSPQRRPVKPGATPNPIFEVDDEWFGDGKAAPAAHRDARDELAAEMGMNDVDLPDIPDAGNTRAETVEPRASRPNSVPPAGGASKPSFEVDDEWFGDRDAPTVDQSAVRKELAAEMGIHDVELSEVPEAVISVAPATDLDFDFGLDPKPDPVAPPADPLTNTPPASVSVGAAALDAQLDDFLGDEPLPAPPQASAPVAPVPEAEPFVVAASDAVMSHSDWAPSDPLAATPVAPVIVAAPTAAGVADDFAALFAMEQGEAPPPVVAPAATEETPVTTVIAPVGTVVPPAAPGTSSPAMVMQVAAPEITSAMLDQIASLVVERLSDGAFDADMRTAITETVLNTVKAVVAETSERLVRDEIARVTAQAEHDTH